MEWLLQKAVESADQSYSYSPQQVAEMLDLNTRNIAVLDARISFTFWILFASIAAFVTMGIVSTWRIERRLKKLELLYADLV